MNNGLIISQEDIDQAKKRANKKIETIFQGIPITIIIGIPRKIELDMNKKARIAEIRKKMKQKTGLSKTERRLAIATGLISADQEYYWTPEWQKGEREADDDEKRKRVTGPFDTTEEAIKYLHALTPEDADRI